MAVLYLRAEVMAALVDGGATVTVGAIDGLEAVRGNYVTAYSLSVRARLRATRRKLTSTHHSALPPSARTACGASLRGTRRAKSYLARWLL